MKKILFTADGLTQLQSDYESLTSKRPAAVADLKAAREKGDLSENSAYRAARSKLSSIDNRLRKIKALLDKAYVVENKNIDYVDIGTYVEVIDENNINQTFRIVNTFESDLAKNQISSFSPIGKALMGKKVNDKVNVVIPNGTKSYLIKNISLEINQI